MASLKLDRSTEITATILIAIFVVILVSGYLFSVGYFVPDAPVPRVGRMQIQSISVAEDTVLARNTGEYDKHVTRFLVRNSGENITLSGGVIGDANIPVSKEKTITLDADLSALPEGNYTLILVTTAGDAFTSPFTVQ